MREETDKLLMVYEQDASIGFKVDPLCFADNLETFYRDVFLVGQTEANQVEHCGQAITETQFSNVHYAIR